MNKRFIIDPSIRIRFRVVFLLSGMFVLVGCGKKEEKFLAVTGKVILNDSPLTSGGVVVFHPDKSRGNTSLHEPRGEINEHGQYELYTAGRKGAPPGVYKVTVFAQKGQVNPNDPYSVPKFTTRTEYTQEDLTPLTVEVKEGAGAEAYTLKVLPP